MKSLLIVLFVFFLGVNISYAGAAEPNSGISKNPEDVSAQTQETVKETSSVVSEDVVKRTVKEIAADKSYIAVDSVKVSTSKEFLEDSYLEVGDKVEVTVEKAGSEIKAKSYNYIFEEESALTESEEVTADSTPVSE